MIITTRVDDEIELTDEESRLLTAVLSLLASKDSDFRQAFVHEITSNFCSSCGGDRGAACNCTRCD